VNPLGPVDAQGQSPVERELGIRRGAGGRVDAREAARKFEAVMIATLVSQMRESSGVHFFGESPGAQIFEGILDQQLGDALAEGRGLGLSRSIEASIMRMEKEERHE